MGSGSQIINWIDYLPVISKAFSFIVKITGTMKIFLCDGVKLSYSEDF